MRRSLALRLLADTTPLRTPDFRRLWLAGIPTVIGANLTVFAVPVQLFELTQNSAYIGLSGLFALVPVVVFGLWGGAWADAMDRRTLLIVTSWGLVAASLLLWLQAALALNNAWVVLCLLSLQQACYAVNSPARSAAFPRILSGDQLPAANSLNMTLVQFGAIFGPALAGGVLLRWLDLSALYLVDTLTCLVPIWATFRLAPIPAVDIADADGTSRWGVRAVLDGFRYLAGNTVVLMSFVVDLIAMVLGLPRALFPQIAHDSFGGPLGGGTAMALLSAAMAVGSMIGGVFSGWLPRIRRQGLAIVASITAWGLAIVGFGLVSGQAHGRAGPMLWAALAFLAVGGAATMVAVALKQTIRQQAASAELVGRLQGVLVVVIAGGPRLADALHGAAGAVIGTSAAVAGGGVLVVVGMLAVSLAAPAFIRYRVPSATVRDDGSAPT
ncbi:MFS transporter [Mycobacterium decipiens]|uniref:MFS transporter n=1 Tax=Mycobacterium decipiens TaxID=1430326 RepID=A0A1X2LXE9_9MYCO|nr:MFS transporter [Mycobacterium decipiens]OSC41853.1 MFS transporter [Mycobacterium decipiens]